MTNSDSISLIFSAIGSLSTACAAFFAYKAYRMQEDRLRRQEELIEKQNNQNEKLIKWETLRERRERRQIESAAESILFIIHPPMSKNQISGIVRGVQAHTFVSPEESLSITIDIVNDSDNYINNIKIGANFQIVEPVIMIESGNSMHRREKIYPIENGFEITSTSLTLEQNSGLVNYSRYTDNKKIPATIDAVKQQKNFRYNQDGHTISLISPLAPHTKERVFLVPATSIQNAPKYYQNSIYLIFTDSNGYTWKKSGANNSITDITVYPEIRN